ncbi:hypothetical protein M378DRAFT_19254 [Amanita muscaria Koide BX008]|uniref:Uncharacterized protein n=1 Tax=Amanita muscaria (strain Koide BX008) TaxID=946122 RepID=A0A0C2SJH1_AMAMK|nr:hypothetical protein M378DRAFT_19254 [Amanita muscaria Koide BX008]
MNAKQLCMRTLSDDRSDQHVLDPPSFDSFVMLAFYSNLRQIPLAADSSVPSVPSVIRPPLTNTASSSHTKSRQFHRSYQSTPAYRIWIVPHQINN